MAFVKNDVTEEELDKLFNENDSSAFIKKDSSSDDKFLSSELDVKSNSDSKIERPDEYQKDKIHSEQLNEKKTEESLFKNVANKVNSITGQVTTRIFNEIAKVRENALLEEYKQRQAKIPKISENAKIKLRSGEDECKFHVYRPYQMMDSDHMMTSCKYCSVSKIFTMQEWMKYQLENKQYM